MVEVIDRCPTGIVGFDRACQGGFVRNSDNLLAGGPGSGKSTFLLQFLWNGATMFNENGLYCSFEPDIVDTLGDAQAYGWDFTRLSAEGRIKFMRFAPQTSINELSRELKRMVAKGDVRRICFDPISVMALNLNDQGKIRNTIFELSSLMKRMKVTTIFADESLEGSMGVTEGDWTKTDILRFLSDSVSILYESGVTGVGDRAIRIVKMRRTKHERKAITLKIGDKGIFVGIEDEPAVKENVVIAAPIVREEKPIIASIPVMPPVIRREPVVPSDVPVMPAIPPVVVENPVTNKSNFVDDIQKLRDGL